MRQMVKLGNNYF